MKTRRQKVFAILAACFLCASFFAVPVSADSYYSANFGYPYEIDGNEWTKSAGMTSTEGVLNNGSYWNFYNPDSITQINNKTNYSWEWPEPFPETKGYVSVLVGISDFGVDYYSETDTVWLTPFVMNLTAETGMTIESYRVSLRYLDGTNIESVVGSTEWSKINLTGKSQRYATSKDRLINITKGGEYDALVVCFDFKVSSLSSIYYFAMGIEDRSLTVNYGIGSDPNFPVFNVPDDGYVSGYIDAEEELLEENQSGLDEADNIFVNGIENITLFAMPFTKISGYLTRLSRFPYFSIIVWISLSIGLFASLLALSASIVGAADRKASRMYRSKSRK